MIAIIQYNSRKLKIDLSKPLDISMPLRASKSNVNAWYIEEPKIKPVKDGEWTASIKEGACVNFNNIFFNPHAHGTHTECVGHITEKVHSINQNLKQFFFLAELITVAPERLNGDSVISKKQLQFAIGNKKREAIVIRTIPNLDEKISAQYSNTNPTYLLEEAAIYLREKEVKHLLIDLPSVDKEKDECQLLAHNAFWNITGKLRMDATITELIYVPNNVIDGTYFVNIQIAPFENDASPSKPILYKIID
ncbi:cyclase family protein [uncultured Algibacter sp.]|uniref:cyclase family protein n=1 Tax=uncultured Algibacter sp. TaxID=298659 RepID=UPI00260FEA08|nr:cyclase family protein [uncultured Algibacter sp.]